MRLEEIDIKELTEKYNKCRLNLSFLTNQATESDIRSLLNIHPQFLKYKEEDLIREIG